MYFGLQTGWISMMSLQSSLLGFALFKPFQSMLRTKFGPIENVVLQSTAVATGTMPLAAGFVGVLPALELMNKNDNESGPIILTAKQLVLWSLGVAFFGVFFAVPLRKQTIVREKLRFPSGTATAQMISLLHQIPDPSVKQGRRRRRIQSPEQTEHQPLLHSFPSYHSSAAYSRQDLSAQISTVDHAFEESWTYKLRALIGSFSLSSAYTLLSYFFPIITALPVFNWLTFNMINLRAWEWYFTPSLSYVGQGVIMGLPTTLSMLLGCVVGWGILSPMAYYAGWAPGPIDDWKTGSKGWILWVSLGVMISESVVSLGMVMMRSLVKLYHSTQNVKRWNSQESDTGETAVAAVEDDDDDDAPAEQRVSRTTTVVGLVLSTLLCVYLVRYIFGPTILSVQMTLLAVAVALLLSVLGVRALGETDLNPVSGIGKISQVIFAAMIPGGIAANLIAGGIAEAGAQQAGDLMQDLKTGHLLHASPKAQFYGQLIGSCVSAFIATFAYILYRTIYSIPGPEFPVPTAQVWLDMSRLVNGHPLPPHVAEFIFLFSMVFAVLVVLKETSATKSRYIPQGIAFAIGIYNPPSFTLARVIGGILGYYWTKYCDADDSEICEQKKGWSRVPLFLHHVFKDYRHHVGNVFIIIVASGFVLGEGTFAIVNMIMRAYDIPHF
ncbi:OPT oligopeptide transporter protein-domain-containing protein [Radiomyces spectabilis]|uniref:OPT oligopeptide transporter protein-domain-containing protein n=1 Tax=Radiomyces spectabilis TaxID=64574 RepID=UPI00221F8369|nr:OPT oligopeptide transporter protein-domain-containing protein [Radiomyces spectabilis]KAI8388029.1 OPT oligopeptide transporter protein-domain-containing protein [Radiomyces spectabilis]